MSNEDKGRLLTADIVCYGTPSPGAFQAYLRMLEKRHGSTIIDYHHKGHGIPLGGSEVAVFADGSRESGSTAAMAWSRTWYDNLVRESCFRCGWHSTRRPGDVTMGDYWGIERIAPDFRDRWGVSLLMANTSAGIGLIRDVSHGLVLLETSVEDAANTSQPMLSRPPERKDRKLFWDSLYADGFESACRAIGVMSATRRMKDLVHTTLKALKGKTATSGDRIASRSAILGVDFSALMERGGYPVVFAAKSRDDKVRRESSSGGMFYALASHVINNLGGVVYGCAFDDGLRAVHARCETMAEAERCMGSKYSQSDMDGVFPELKADLESGRTVLFTGTPCQVAAVRSIFGQSGGEA